MMPKQKPGRSKQNYATPDDFIKAVKKRYRISEFSHDFAADEFNTKASTFFSELDSAFDHSPKEWGNLTTQSWGWLNPPFSDITKWANRANEAANCFGAQILMLVPASVGSNWFARYVHQRFNVSFLNGRIHFDPNNPTWGYPKDCMLIEFKRPIYSVDYDVWRWK